MSWIQNIFGGFFNIKVPQKTTESLPSKGYSALVIGDSHTVPNNGWFEAMAKKYQLGATAKQAKNGRTTDTMLANLRLYLAANPAPNYIIMWGGANDAYGSIAQEKTIKNVQAMIDLANQKGSKFVVVKGYDPAKVSTSFNMRYFPYSTQAGLLKGRDNYVKLLSAYDTQLKNAAKIVPAYPSFTRADSYDGLHLHMDRYKKLGEWIGSKVFVSPTK